MDKKKKFWAIALISLLVVILTFVIVYWAVNGKEETIAFFGRVKDFVNQPIPIIGFSALTLAAIIFKLVSMSSWGRKAVEDAKRELDAFKKQQEEEKAKAKEEAELYKTALEDFVNGIAKKQGIGENDIAQVEGFIQNLPYKGAKEFHLEHKEKKQ